MSAHLLVRGAGQVALDGLSPVLDGLGPVLDANTRLLVLGSFPGAASLQVQQYYGHPRNHFWPILAALWGVELRDATYARRLDVARVHGLGLWDVYASCRRIGSLDRAIEAPLLNDLGGLRVRAPGLRAIVHNGGESARAMVHTRALGLPVQRLPSTSPANASWSFERKLAAWRTAFEEHGMT